MRVLFCPGPSDLGLPTGFGTAGQPETPLYPKTPLGTLRDFTNCYNSNPTNGASIAMLWLDREGIAIPVAAVGRANDWSALKTEAFKLLRLITGRCVSGRGNSRSGPSTIWRREKRWPKACSRPRRRAATRPLSILMVGRSSPQRPNCSPPSRWAGSIAVNRAVVSGSLAGVARLARIAPARPPGRTDWHDAAVGQFRYAARWRRRTTVGRQRQPGKHLSLHSGRPVRGRIVSRRSPRHFLGHACRPPRHARERSDAARREFLAFDYRDQRRRNLPG